MVSVFLWHRDPTGI